MHTKGEWKITDVAFARWSTYRKSVTGARNFVTMDLGQVAEIHGDTEDESLANAHLIASAPDMYEALKEARTALTIKLDTPTYQEIIDFKNRVEPMILRALAKADGK